jgi:hypothetical protein
MKITPGPWEISHEDHAYAILSKGFVIADVFHEEEKGKTTGAQSTEEAKANALLIAAAPELLATCKAFVKHIESLPDDTEKCRHLRLALENRPGELLMEAIAKAEGSKE